MSAGTTQRYVFVDALRGFAALAVVAFHALRGDMLSALDSAWPSFLHSMFANGVAGVFVFFVLSGFVIAHCSCREDVTPRYAAFFMGRRSVRLDPPYWVSMMLAVGLACLPALVDSSKVLVLPTVQDVVLHVTYLVVLLGGTEIDPVYWTLCLEIQFYVVFMIAMIAVSRLGARIGRERALSVVLWTCTAFANLWPLGVAPFELHGLFVEHWSMFLLGVLVWRARDGSPLHVVVAATEIVILAAAALAHSDYPALVGALGAAALLAAGLRGKLHVWLSNRVFQFFGTISYSLYLTHNPVCGTVFRVGYRLTGRSLWTEALWLVLALATCVATAWAFHRAIERPSIRLSHRVPLRPRGTTA